jgi:hypothetical protein
MNESIHPAAPSALSAAPPEPGTMARMKAATARIVRLFVAVIVVLMVGTLVLYFAAFLPALRRVEAQRDAAIRAQVAGQIRVRAVEARYALTVMDTPAAKLAAVDVKDQLAVLEARVPRDSTFEASTLKDAGARAALLVETVERDPVAARQDLELISERLARLYPPIPARPGGGSGSK